MLNKLGEVAVTWLGQCIRHLRSEPQNRSCSVRRLGCFYASDAIRPSDKVVIEGRISHFVASIVTTKHGNAPVNFQNKKRQLMAHHNEGKSLLCVTHLYFFQEMNVH
jgi:hypothetical protein